MPVIIPEDLPATQALKDFGIFVMPQGRAKAQDIRPVRICILNLMPDKITAETQLLSRLSNGILQVEVTLLAIENHISKNTKQSHLDNFYSFFSDIKDQYFDGMIITGAPIEHLPFEEVTYWDELTTIFDWAESHVFSTLFICWGSQAGLYHHYGIQKHDFPNKLSGVFKHIKERQDESLLIGIDDEFYVPQSRNTESDQKAIRANEGLDVIASSQEGGIHIVASKDRRKIFVAGHHEYNPDTLKLEYERDLAAGNATLPINYFENNDPNGKIQTTWLSTASVFFQNWLNYYVYQTTDFNFIKRNS